MNARLLEFSAHQRRAARRSEFERISQRETQAGGRDSEVLLARSSERSLPRRAVSPSPPRPRQEADILPAGVQDNNNLVVLSNGAGSSGNIVTLTHGVPSQATGRPSRSSPANVLPSGRPSSGRPAQGTPISASRSAVPSAVLPGFTSARGSSSIPVATSTPVTTSLPSTTFASITTTPTPSASVVPVIGLPEQAGAQPSQAPVVATPVPAQGSDAGAIVGIVLLVLAAVGVTIGGLLAVRKCMKKRKNRDSFSDSTLPMSRAPSDEMAMARTFPQIAGQLGAIAEKVEREGDGYSRPGRMDSPPAGAGYYGQRRDETPDRYIGVAKTDDGRFSLSPNSRSSPFGREF